ncbi:uncharacterized protein [Diabrotica undecimpunctata]|uniref:uncharacterized protein n=1 Tax=Diabrotica undecimpunctata TaxID=50387 RepID=UPI003B631A81
MSVLLDFVLAHAKHDTRPYLSITILGNQFLALLDSGCSKTVIGSLGWERLKRVCTLKPSGQPKECTVANGVRCPILGSITIPIQLQDRVKIMEVMVVPSLPHTAILGIDFWISMNIVPDLYSGQWSFRTDNDLPLNHIMAIHSVERLSTTQKMHLDELIETTFRAMGSKIGCTDLVEHEIRTTAQPIKQRHYPLSPALQKHVNTELDKMLKEDIIEPSTYP